MNTQLDGLIDRFLSEVEWAISCLRGGSIPLPDSNRDWSTARLPHSGGLPSGATYYRHGFGVEVKSDTRCVDFDFGDNGQTNGFDAWRLMQFAQVCKFDCGLRTETEFDQALELQQRAGFLKREGSLYYRVNTGTRP